MLELKFQKPVYDGKSGDHEFREGRNTTIRKGRKWHIKPMGVIPKGQSSLVRLIDADTGEKLGIGYIIDTSIKQFEELKRVDVIHEHDYNLTNLDELYKRMVTLYRNFNNKTWVTIVNFRFDHEKQTVN